MNREFVVVKLDEYILSILYSTRIQYMQCNAYALHIRFIFITSSTRRHKIHQVYSVIVLYTFNALVCLFNLKKKENSI